MPDGRVRTLSTDAIPVMTDPAAAIAAARCLAARNLPGTARTLRTHPRACGWEDYETDALRKLVDSFNEWSDYSDRHRTSGRHDVRAWAELPRLEQERRIVAAQAFPEVVEAPPPPVPDPVPEPAAEDEQAWLG